MEHSKALPITLTNTGKNRSIRVSKISRSNGLFSIVDETLPLTLAPGRSRTLKIRFRPSAKGTASGDFTFSSNALNSSLEMTAHGTGVTGALVSAPRKISFGDVPLQKVKAEYTTLMNASSTPVKISAVTAADNEFSIQDLKLPLTLRIGESYTFKSIFRPKSKGNKKASLTVISNAADSTLKVSLAGNGTAAVQHSVTLSWRSGGTGVAGYNVYRSESPGSDYSRLNQALDAKTTFSDGSVDSGKTYFYVTTAVSAAGAESGYSNQVKATVP